MLLLSYLINSNIEKPKKQQIKGNKRKNMKIYNIDDELLPIIITDLGGKILHLSELAKKDFYPLKTGDTIFSLIRYDSIKKVSMFSKIDIVALENCNYERAVVKSSGQGITKTLEITFFHSTSNDFKKDEKLYSGYGDVISSKERCETNLNELLEQIVAYMKKDLRFSYKQFEIIKSEKSPVLYANLLQMCMLVVGIISVFNEIDYKAPIKIGIEKQENDYIVSLTLSKITIEKITSLQKLIVLYPFVASRLEFLSSLCKDSNTKYRFSSKPDGIKAELEITNIIDEAGRFAQSFGNVSFEDIVAYAMSIFSYDDVSDTKEEEQE